MEVDEPQLQPQEQQQEQPQLESVPDTDGVTHDNGTNEEEQTQQPEQQQSNADSTEPASNSNGTSAGSPPAGGAGKPIPPLKQSEATFIQLAKEKGFTSDDLPENYSVSLKRAVDFASQWQNTFINQFQQRQQMFQLQEQAMVARNLAACCRIYVGSIIFELAKDDIVKIFEPFGYVKFIDLPTDPSTGKHKGYCFIDFDAPEAATLAVNKLNGAILGKRQLRVGRPNNYPSDQPNNGLPQPPPERIYIANIHPNVSESDIQIVFEPFGAVKRVALIPDPPTGKHKGYGYLEYEDPTCADFSVETMQSFDLGGQILTVGKAIAGLPWPKGMKESGMGSNAAPDISAQQQAAAQLVATIAASSNKGGTTSTTTPGITTGSSAPSAGAMVESLDDNMTIRGGDQRWQMMQRLASRGDDSRVAILRNMVKASDIDDTLEEEVAEECGKFGDVKRVVISVQKRYEEDEDPIVKIFVLFDSPAAAQVTVSKFNGRYFAQNRITAELYDEGRDRKSVV